jgi:hypothetical protein
MQLEAQAHQAKENRLNREHQTIENQLNRDFQGELTAYIKKCDYAMMKEKMEADRFLFEERKKLDLELQNRAHEFQLKLAVIQGQLTRQTEEFRRTLDRYPWGLPPSTILQIYGKYQDRSKPVPPLVILSPPILEYDRFSSTSSGLPKIEKSLAEDVRTFLDEYYPINHPINPTNFIGGIWETKARHSENAIVLLYSMFSSIPTFIFESETEGEYLNFRIASWDIGQEVYNYKSVLSHFSCTDFLRATAKEQAIQWKQQKENLLKKGRKPEELKKLGGDNEINLSILEYEEGLKAEGFEASLEYRIDTPQCVKKLTKYLRILHCVFVGLATDEYYFLRYAVNPQLPNLLGHLIEDLPESEISSLIEVVTAYYQKFYDALKEQDSPFLPEFALEVAGGLAHLAEVTWLTKWVKGSMKSWLELRGISSYGKIDLLKEMKSVWSLEDQEYVEKLFVCLSAIGDTEWADQVDATLTEWRNSKIKGFIRRDSKGETLYGF